MSEEEKKPTLPKIMLYCHLYNEIEKGIIQSVKIEISPEVIRILDLKASLLKLLENLFKSSNIKYTPISISKTLFSPAMNDTSKIRTFFKNKNDVFVKVKTEVIPIEKTNKDINKNDIVLSYKTINDYSFYVSSENYVRVLVPIPGIEKVPKENIVTNFTENSLEVKVNNALNGNNYRFAVPRLDANIIPEKCDAFVKDDRLIIKLKKAKNDDHWSYLFKQKYVGE